MKRAAFFLLFLVASCVPAHADASHTSAELATLSPEAEAPGRARLALRFKMEPGWHIYGKDPGEAGLPPRVKWTLPEGVKAGEFEWPEAKQITGPPITTYGYEGSAELPFELEIPATYAGGTLPVRAKVDWLSCNDDECVPGSAELTLDIPLKQKHQQRRTP